MSKKKQKGRNKILLVKVSKKRHGFENFTNGFIRLDLCDNECTAPCVLVGGHLFNHRSLLGWGGARCYFRGFRSLLLCLLLRLLTLLGLHLATSASHGGIFAVLSCLAPRFLK